MRSSLRRFILLFGLVAAACSNGCTVGSARSGNAYAPAYGLSYYGGPVVAYGWGGGYLMRGNDSNPRWSNSSSGGAHDGHAFEVGHTGVYGGGPQDTQAQNTRR